MKVWIIFTALFVSAHCSTIVVQPSSSVAASSSAGANEATPSSSGNDASSTSAAAPSPSNDASSSTNPSSVIVSSTSAGNVAASSSSANNVVASSSISPSPSSSQPTPSSSQAPQGTPQTMKLTFKILNENYTSDLGNSNSAAFIAMANNLKAGMAQQFVNDTDYLRTEVTKFENGSVIASINAFFKSDCTLVSKVFWISTDPFQTTFSIGEYSIDKFTLKASLVTHGRWGAWTDSELCNSKTSKKKQIRHCTPPQLGGEPCSGSDTQYVSCTPTTTTTTKVSSAKSLVSSLVVCITMIIVGKQFSS